MRAAFGSSLLLAALLAAGPAPAADFYEGKTVTILVGSDVGGGFDAFARMLARHFGRAIPGNPNIVVENMPGAGSAIAAGHIYAKAAKDGTVVGALNPGGLLTPLFEKRATAYDTTKFRFLGSASATARLCISRKQSRVKDWDFAMKQKVIAGAAAVASASWDYAQLHKAAHAGNFDIVSGYKGTGEILLAMERNEVEVTCGLDRSSLRSQRNESDYNLLLRVSVKPEPELEAMGVPEANSFARNDTERAIGDLVGAQQIFGRPYLVAPDVPAERLAILRGAFDTVMRNSQFAAEAANVGLHIDPANGERVEQAIKAMYATPAPIVEATRKAIRP